MPSRLLIEQTYQLDSGMQKPYYLAHCGFWRWPVHASLLLSCEMKIRVESRTKFERMGIKQVRIELSKGIDSLMLPEPQQRSEAQEWLEGEQERLMWRDDWRYWAMFIVSAIAALAACIAAWPEVKSWFV